MRSREFTDEAIIKIPQIDFEADDNNLPTGKKLKQYLAQSRRLTDQLAYTVDKTGAWYGSGIDMFIFKEGQTVGWINVYPVLDWPTQPAYTVPSIMVRTTARGQGISKLLYQLVFTELKGCILAGEQQTPGGRRNWVALNSTPGVRVYGWASLDQKYLQRMKKFKVQDKFNANLEKNGAKLLGNARGQDFYIFPVAAERNILEPLITKTFKLYQPNPYNSDSYVHTGLVAYSNN